MSERVVYEIKGYSLVTKTNKGDYIIYREEEQSWVQVATAKELNEAKNKAYAIQKERYSRFYY